MHTMPGIDEILLSLNDLPEEDRRRMSVLLVKAYVTGYQRATRAALDQFDKSRTFINLGDLSNGVQESTSKKE